MKQTQLGQTDLMVSEFCLGSMTWGTQTTEEDGHRQIDASLDAGINFIDTAEAYPVNPMTKEGAGRTEEILGNWLAKSGRRDEVVIATKVAGKGNYIRDGEEISAKTIREAIDGSLKRMQTDVIDLYQLHWPNRGSYMFRQNWTYDPSFQNKEAVLDHMREVLDELQRQVDRGTIRHFGLSNESAWGTAMWLKLSEEMSAPRVESIQNEYSLMCRFYDTDLAELSHNEVVTCLAFSPLAAGYLTGKYTGGAVPEGSRKSINETMGGRAGERTEQISRKYVELAQEHGVDPIHMALAFCRQRPFPCIPIFGATTQEQLDLILKGTDVTLDKALLKEIDALNRANPCPY